MPLQIGPLQPEWLPAAGALLAARQGRDRILAPLLPARFEDAATCTRAVEAALKRPQASGVAAFDGDRLAAYLVGDLVLDEVWGRSAWVRLAGCAYDPAVGVEIVRDLYAALGAGWVRRGVYFHFVLAPTTNEALVQAWFSLSFGIEQVHALLDLETVAPNPPPAPAGVEIRGARREDGPALARMSDVIWRAQTQAPVWAAKLPESVAGTADGWAELADDKEATVWLALEEGELLGMQGYWAAEESDDDLGMPPQAVHLAVAGTRPEARGRGLNSALTAHGLAQARAAGFRVCETDWRSTNLLSARFWPRRGFRPSVYRLARRVDQRIAWSA
jgi:ribosomal protein S18 acetylase RimI-like enzyme